MRDSVSEPMTDPDTIPSELAGRFSSRVILKQDVFSTVERGAFGMAIFGDGTERGARLAFRIHEYDGGGTVVNRDVDGRDEARERLTNQRRAVAR